MWVIYNRLYVRTVTVILLGWRAARQHLITQRLRNHGFLGFMDFTLLFSILKPEWTKGLVKSVWKVIFCRSWCCLGIISPEKLILQCFSQNKFFCYYLCQKQPKTTQKPNKPTKSNQTNKTQEKKVLVVYKNWNGLWVLRLGTKCAITEHFLYRLQCFQHLKLRWF